MIRFPGGSAGKESAFNVGDLGSIPGLGRSPGEGKGYPLQYSGLENSMDCIVHGVAKIQTRLRETFAAFYTMEFYCIHSKNVILPFAATWIDLENIMQSKLSVREKQIPICRI